jgi:hypothetical protein
MSATKWRKDGRYVKDDPEVNSLELFATEVELKRKVTQDQPRQTTASIQVAVAEPIRTAEQFGSPQSEPQRFQDLPSEIVQFCYQGQPAEFRMYGGFIRFL